MNPSEGIFMSIAAALGPESKSFEEVRIEDYIRAYQATGRPPPPCPQEPADETQRKLLNLPPLFKPQTSLTSPPDPTMEGAATNLAILDPSQLPRGQEFRVYSNAGEKYHCISAMPEYANFCQEELRYYAYLLGNKQSPVPIAMDPFVLPVKQVVTTPPASAEESLQSLVAQPAYAKHSPEELRVAYLLHRRELTSAELIQLQNPSAFIPPSTAIAPPPPSTPIVPSTPSIPKPIFASTAPSLPKFTFGFK
ncbi:hypothetical protein M413DRAFT_448821 [Hebeloma cylindrosporum]|uniref:Uncharacterized protein n=1 Tax=Hebeloma cylindrosporum TaxID=76867 RepID=A0A0C3BXV4_HEBCY|nr:hypothetical protein M413DRAFT_448821 [Hebeloma cylindrosporum h7]